MLLSPGRENLPRPWHWLWLTSRPPGEDATAESGTRPRARLWPSVSSCAQPKKNPPGPRGLPVLDASGGLVGIITQSDVFRAFMHITGALQGGVQFALRLPDRPGLIKEVVDLLRARGARFVSLLSSYATAQEGFRDVYIRVRNLSPEAVAAAKEELASRYELLYVIPEA